jgi:hypothetical protein
MTPTTISSDTGLGRKYSLAADVRLQMGRLRSVALLLLAVVLVAGPVLAWFNSQTKSLDANSAWMVWSFLKDNYMPFYILAFSVGVGGGLWAESYQQIARQSNFYHALSPRRGQLLGARVLAVVILQAGLTLVAVAGIVLVGLVSPAMSLDGFMPRLVVFGLAHWLNIMLVCLMALSVMLLAGQLAGSLASQVIMALVLFVSPALCGLAVNLVLDATATTYVSEGLAKRLMAFDPLYPWVISADSGFRWRSSGISVLDIPFSEAFWAAAPYVSYLLVIAVSLGLTFRLYRRRPAEKAGETLVYRPVGSLIKLEFAILASLFVGTMFYGMSYSQVWAFGLGAVFATLVVQMVSEMIYAQDTRGWKNRPVWALVGLVLACLIFGVCASGLAGYDRHVPQATSLRAVQISAFGSDGDGEADLSLDQDPAYIEKAAACLQDLAASHTADGAEAASEGTSVDDKLVQTETGSYLTVQASYRTRTGLETSRIYTIPAEKAREILTPLLEDPAYSRTYFGSLQDLKPQDIEDMTVSLNSPLYMNETNTEPLIDNKSTAAQSDRAKALLEAMQQDLAARSAEAWASNSLAMVDVGRTGDVKTYVVRQGDTHVRALIEDWTSQGLFGENAKAPGAAVLAAYDAAVVTGEGQSQKVAFHITDPQTLTDVLADGIIVDGIPVDADPSARLRLTSTDDQDNIYVYAFRQGHVPAEKNSTQGEQSAR